MCRDPPWAGGPPLACGADLRGRAPDLLWHPSAPAPCLPPRPAPPLLTVTCTATVSYGGDLTCWAASTDVNGNFAEAGTFTFDKAQALAATWTARTCVVNKSQCEVDATLATPPGAQPRTVVFVVGFKGVDGATVSTSVSVDLVLRPTVTQLVCDQSGLPLGGSTHCVVGVADQLYAWDSHPAQLGPGVAGLTVTSSAPGDTVTYDKPAPGGASCLAAVVDALLSCGLTLAADQVPGCAPSRPPTRVTRWPTSSRAPWCSAWPTAHASPRSSALTCPAAVPARSPVATCQVSVQPTGPGLVEPTGAVAFDQDSGQAVDWADSQVCQLDAGTCSVPISVFSDWSSGTTAPIRATYAGDDGYLPASADQQVDVTPTATTSQIACDNPSPAAGSLLHCQLTFSTVDGGPVPVGPLDAIFVSTSEGTVTCDLDAADGCGHVNTATATVAGFSLQLDQTTGPQLLIGEYTGDDFDMVAGSTAAFSWVVPGPPVVTPQPAPVPPAKATTTTSIACAGPVAYRHATSCTVAVTSASGVPTGTVSVTPAGGLAVVPGRLVHAQRPGALHGRRREPGAPRSGRLARGGLLRVRCRLGVNGYGRVHGPRGAHHGRGPLLGPRGGPPGRGRQLRRVGAHPLRRGGRRAAGPRLPGHGQRQGRRDRLHRSPRCPVVPLVGRPPGTDLPLLGTGRQRARAAAGHGALHRDVRHHPRRGERRPGELHRQALRRSGRAGLRCAGRTRPCRCRPSDRCAGLHPARPDGCRGRSRSTGSRRTAAG